MKNVLPIIFLLFIGTLAVNAQGAKKYVLFCRFCAGHPVPERIQREYERKKQFDNKIQIRAAQQKK